MVVTIFKRLTVILIPVVILASIYIYLFKNAETAQPENNLVVYTYSSFANAWGVGPELKKLFKEKTGINVSFIDVGEAGIIIQRLLLEKKDTTADVVLGLDQFNLGDEDFSSLFSEILRPNFVVDDLVPLEKVKNGPFVAYSWSPMTLVHRVSDGGFVPKEISDLASSNFKNKIVILDPRTSAPGYIFFHWLVQSMGEEGAKNFISKIKKNVYAVTPSWSAGYGFFKKHHAQYIFSYLTSPVYHWTEENNDDYQPLYLKDPLPYHIEYAGILKSSKNKEHAEIFIKFLFDSEVQKMIMSKNYMLPITAGVREKTKFNKLHKVDLEKDLAQISRKEILKIWNSIP